MLHVHEVAWLRFDCNDLFFQFLNSFFTILLLYYCLYITTRTRRQTFSIQYNLYFQYFWKVFVLSIFNTFAKECIGIGHYLIVYYIAKIWHFWYQIAIFPSNQCKCNFRQNALVSRKISPKFYKSSKNALFSRIFLLVTGMY